MLKVLVIGSPGAGKSTFARKLSAVTGLPLYYLDLLWHKPDKTNLAAEEFDLRLNEMMEKTQWIIDGNYLRTLELRLQSCDTVFLLDFPLEVCLSGAKSRIGKKREDFPWIEAEMDEEFKQWIVDFPKDQLPHIYELLEKYKDGKEIFVFYTREEADRCLRKLSSDKNGCRIFPVLPVAPSQFSQFSLGGQPLPHGKLILRGYLKTFSGFGCKHKSRVCDHTPCFKRLRHRTSCGAFLHFSISRRFFLLLPCPASRGAALPNCFQRGF